MNKMDFSYNRIKNSLGVFSLILCIQIITLIIGGYYPFGDKTYLVWDMKAQYVSFFAWLNNVIWGRTVDTLTYSFSMSYGGSTLLLIGYYLISPFNVILLFFPLQSLPIGIEIVTILKICTCGVTMYHFLSKRFEEEGLKEVVFAVIYALMGYVVVYQSDIMWLDGVIMLPLLMLELYRLVKGQKRIALAITVALTIIFDFYIAYMILIFSFFYLLMEMTLVLRKEERRIKNALHIIGRYFLLTFSGIGMSAFILMPIAYEVRGIGRAENEEIQYTFEHIFRLNDNFLLLPLKNLLGAYDIKQLISGLPNIYVSALCVIMAILFLADSRNRVRDRLAYGVMCLFFILSFASVGLNYVWHGFTYTSGSPYRYSFLLTAIVVIMGYRQFCLVVKEKKLFSMGKAVVILPLMIIWAGAALFIQYRQQILSFTSIQKEALTALFYVTILGILITIVKSDKHIWKSLILMLICIEMIINLSLSNDDFKYAKLSDYREHVSEFGSVCEELAKDNNGEFFRIEHAVGDNLNDALLIGYPSITHYSSGLRVEVADYANENRMLIDGYGIQATGYKADMVTAMDAGELCIKYLIVSELPADEDMYGWNIIKEKPYYVLENEYYEKLAFMEDKYDAARIDISMPKSTDIEFRVSDVGEAGNTVKTSIPYRRGWKVWVDGERYEPQAPDLMMCMSLTAGDHIINMQYTQPFLIMGTIISIIALIFVICIKMRYNH